MIGFFFFFLVFNSWCYLKDKPWNCSFSLFIRSSCLPLSCMCVFWLRKSDSESGGRRGSSFCCAIPVYFTFDRDLYCLFSQRTGVVWDGDNLCFAKPLYFSFGRQM